MAKAVLEKAICEKCGADVREGTAFCYSCGAPIEATPAVAEQEPDVQATLRMETDGHDAAVKKEAKLSRAAEERKKARVAPRKSTEYTWEPVTDSWRTLLAAFLIFGLVLVVVGVMVFWK